MFLPKAPSDNISRMRIPTLRYRWVSNTFPYPCWSYSNQVHKLASGRSDHRRQLFLMSNVISCVIPSLLSQVDLFTFSVGPSMASLKLDPSTCVMARGFVLVEPQAVPVLQRHLCDSGPDREVPPTWFKLFSFVCCVFQPPWNSRILSGSKLIAKTAVWYGLHLLWRVDSAGIVVLPSYPTRYMDFVSGDSLTAVVRLGEDCYFAGFVCKPLRLTSSSVKSYIFLIFPKLWN